jgi:hypothetical protein
MNLLSLRPAASSRRCSRIWLVGAVAGATALAIAARPSPLATRASPGHGEVVVSLPASLVPLPLVTTVLLLSARDR